MFIIFFGIAKWLDLCNKCRHVVRVLIFWRHSGLMVHRIQHFTDYLIVILLEANGIYSLTSRFNYISKPIFLLAQHMFEFLVFV